MAESPQRETLIDKLLHAARLLEASDLYLDVGEVHVSGFAATPCAWIVGR
jgi:hypothetical protein